VTASLALLLLLEPLYMVSPGGCVLGGVGSFLLIPWSACTPLSPLSPLVNHHERYWCPHAGCTWCRL
jgi:hypothetical protein